MTLTVPRQKFLAMLTSVAGVCNKKPTSPILGMVRLSCDGNVLTAQASNHATWTMRQIAAAGQFPATCLDPATIIGLVKSAPSGDVVVLTAPDSTSRVGVTIGAVKSRLASLDGQDFPVAPTDDGGSTILVKCDELADVLARVLPSVGAEDNKYGLNGALLEMISGAVRIVTTDGNRLTYDEVPVVEGELSTSRNRILPGAVMSEIAALAREDGSATAEVTLFERSIRVRVGTSSLIGRLGEAEFPDYRQVIPTTFKGKVKASKDDVIAAIKAIMPTVGDANNTVQVKASDNSMSLVSRKTDVGETSVDVGCEVWGDVPTFGVNAKFLLDALTHLPVADVVWEVGGAVQPTRISCEGAVWILMPVRLT